MVPVKTYEKETCVHKTTQENTNNILCNGYEVENDQQSEPDNKPIDRCKNTDCPRYKQVCLWNGIYHRRPVG